VPIVLAATLGPIKAFGAAMIGISKVFTIVAIRGKTLAVALKTVGASWITAAAPVIGVIAAIAAVAGVFLFVKKNAAAFQIALTNIFIKLREKVLRSINGLIDGINPLLSAVGLQIEKNKIEPAQLIDQPKFQSFSEFIGSVKDDLVDLVPGLSSAAEGFGKLKSALFGGGEADTPTNLGIEGAFDGFTGLPGQGGSEANPFKKQVDDITASLQAVQNTGGLATIAPPQALESLTAAQERLAGINETMKQAIVDTSNYGSALSTFSEKFPLLAEQISAVGQALQQGLTVAFEDMFTTIIEGGKNAFGSFAKALGQAVKQMLVQLAAAIAQAAILALLINAIFPGAGGFKGVFSGLLKGGNLFSFIPGFAEGGIVPGGYPNDTYLARLSSGEAVIPLSKLNNMTQQSQPMVAETVIRGEDIVLSFNRASKTLGR